MPDELEPIPIGKGRVVREGEDVTVIAIGPLVHRTLEAAEEAEKNGVSVEVVDPRSLQPLDEALLVESVKKTNRCVVAHEAITRMGFGAEVAAVIQYQAFDWLDAPIERVGAQFAPLAFAPVMEQFSVPGPRNVLEAIYRHRRKRWATGRSSPPAPACWLAQAWVGQGMESGTIVKWLKSEGERVEKGEPLYELDTDKVTQEVEADASGVLLRIACRKARSRSARRLRSSARRGRRRRSRRSPAQTATAPPRPRRSRPEPRRATTSASGPPSIPRRVGIRAGVRTSRAHAGRWAS